MLLYFVVKVGDSYVVWEITAKEMYARVNADPTLGARLERAPFASRAEAEKRRDELNKGSG
jgi:hypothetical protein